MCKMSESKGWKAQVLLTRNDTIFLMLMIPEEDVNLIKCKNKKVLINLKEATHSSFHIIVTGYELAGYFKSGHLSLIKKSKKQSTPSALIVIESSSWEMYL
ncbi:hypothetical protein RCL_jg13890.t1 [Rhizophagus clarus]|uniref:Uncharacterized protein n=1 Tax=Rhizophagus clarus TaxID=94130 RepID=A0A8H3LSF6_9GLOM|nr:hypothetical protein RCL_jg13890.t1 [Rhizophagus clarus]